MYDSKCVLIGGYIGLEWRMGLNMQTNLRVVRQLDYLTGWCYARGYRVLDVGLDGEGRRQLLETKDEQKVRDLLICW